jgi:hypothetical protein
MLFAVVLWLGFAHRDICADGNSVAGATRKSSEPMLAIRSPIPVSISPKGLRPLRARVTARPIAHLKPLEL